MDSNAWRSRKGWFTIIDRPPGLGYIEVSKSESQAVRELGGILFDREGFADEIIKQWVNLKTKRFAPLCRFRLFIPPKTHESQLTGWKPYDDKGI